MSDLTFEQLLEMVQAVAEDTTPEGERSFRRLIDATKVSLPDMLKARVEEA